jgi:hypothetical protein
MKIGFIKDVFGGMPHVMATSNNEKIQVKAITEYGKSIVSDFKFDIHDIKSTVPDGFIFTGFFENSKTTEDEPVSKTIEKKSYRYVATVNNSKNSNQDPIENTPIRAFSSAINKLNAISFKTSNFKNLKKRSEFKRRIKSGKVFFDEKSRAIKSHPKAQFGKIETELIYGQFGQGFIRRTAKRKTADTSSSRRLARRTKTLESITRESMTGQKESISALVSHARNEIKNAR